MAKCSAESLIEVTNPVAFSTCDKGVNFQSVYQFPNTFKASVPTQQKNNKSNRSNTARQIKKCPLFVELTLHFTHHL